MLVKVNTYGVVKSCYEINVSLGRLFSRSDLIFNPPLVEIYPVTMHFCPNNISFTDIWINNGVSPCFMDTISSVFLFSYIAICGGIEHIIYKRYSTPVDSGLVKKSCLYNLQIALCVLLPVISLLRFVLQVTLIGHGVVCGYIVLYFVMTVLYWPFSLSVILLERHKALPSVPTSGHGLVLLIFWTLTLANENLVFLSWNKKSWWFSIESLSDKIELSLFISRYVCTLSLFILGLKAPGLPTYREYIINSRHTGIQIESQPLIEPDANPRSTFANFFHKLSLLLPFIWPKRNLRLQFQVLFCLVLLICGRVITVYIPIISKKIINSLTGPKLTFRWDYILLYVGFWFLQGQGANSFISNLRSFLWIRVQQYTVKETQVEVYSHLHNLSLRWHISRKTGEVLRIMDRGTSSVTSLLNYLLFSIFPTIADISIAIIFFITSFNAWFGLIVFVAMAVYLTVTIVMTEWRTKFRRSMNKDDNATEAKAVDALLNFETVKYYNAEQYEIEHYRKLIDVYQVSEWKASASLSLLNTMQSSVITLAVLAGSLLCADLVVAGDGLTVGDYVLFTTYLFQLYTPLNFFGTYYRMIQTAFIDMENMFELLNVAPEVRDDPNAVRLKVLGANLSFQNVSFSYSPDRPILKNISFEACSGKTVALVGPSGAGKSTLIRLMFRLYDTTSGRILFDNQDIKMVTQESLRKNIGVVPQDTVLFNDTLMYNIRYGRVDATEEEIEAAAQAADIHQQILSFTKGYDTIVGERGLKLSGGEKQRVAIARTILKNPYVVLLDEATSALDTNTERNIQSALNKMCANRTTIIVAHRLSTIIHADTILVLKDGEIVERGRHEELLSDQGLYASMWLQQQEKQKMESESSDSVSLNS